MENKLTWVELKKTVARQTDLTEKEVNLILTIWLDEMIAALKRGEEVHISGLGTFKMKTMKPRKSVDVTTGQAIILPETDRLTFAMAAALEEQMSNDTPTRKMVENDPIKKLSDQADEIMDILGQIKGLDGEETKRREGEEAKRREGEEAKRREGEETKRREGEVVKKDRWWLTVGMTVMVFLAMLIGLFFFFQHKLEQWLMNLREQAEMVEVTEPTEPKAIEAIEAIDTIATIEAIGTIDTIGAIETIETISDTTINHRSYTEFIGEEEMRQGSRLAWMAYRYYGNKKLWVFIYDANRDHLTNPEVIAIGTSIKIPKLDQSVIDFSTPEIQELVEQMSNEFLRKR